MPLEDPNAIYKSVMENVEIIAKKGEKPTIKELLQLAQLEQLHRIANALEKLNAPKTNVSGDLDNLIWARVAWINRYDFTNERKYRVEVQGYIDEWEGGRCSAELMNESISNVFNELQGVLRERT